MILEVYFSSDEIIGSTVLTFGKCSILVMHLSLNIVIAVAEG